MEIENLPDIANVSLYQGDKTDLAWGLVEHTAGVEWFAPLR